jgi:transposase
VEIDVAEADKTCACGHARTRIGETITAKLEYEPASFVVIETARAKYACPQSRHAMAWRARAVALKTAFVGRLRYGRRPSSCSARTSASAG